MELPLKEPPLHAMGNKRWPRTGRIVGDYAGIGIKVKFAYSYH